MRWLVLLLCLLVSGCASNKVQRLDIRDPRLPIEARRWLADAEEEVAIASARVDDARMALEALEAYRTEMLIKLEKAEQGQASEVLTLPFQRYLDARVTLRRSELDAARIGLELARARLTQARAETAVRYDLAVVPLEPIAAEVEQKKAAVAEARKTAETQRADVGERADEAWKAFALFVARGGESNALWGIR